MVPKEVNDRTAEEAPAEQPQYRVLSLGGGGIKGVFGASFLATLEEMTGKSIADHFDLIAGTSTGGIIALGLGLGFSGDEILQFYLDNGRKIFPATGSASRGLRAVRHAFRAKYHAKDLESALRDIFGERKLGESTSRLVIPSFDAANGDVHLFKTAHHPRLKRDYLVAAADVALATSAAPTFFPHFERGDGSRFVDGGVWANDPTAVALIEAMAVLGWPREEIKVLSIGSVSAPYHVPKSKSAAGWIPWNKGLVDLLLRGQQAGALGMANVITEHTRMLRVDETAAGDRFSFDDANKMDELRSLGRYAARHKEKEVRHRFLDRNAAEFRPCHHLDTADTHGPR